MKHRVVGIIIQDGKVLLMHRIKNEKDYYVFPGGGVEEGETLEEAVRREIREETSFVLSDFNMIFELKNQFSDQYSGNIIGYAVEHYFLIKNFSGLPELGGPEKLKVSAVNQYLFEWVDRDDLEQMPNVYPKEAVMKIIELLT